MKKHKNKEKNNQTNLIQYIKCINLDLEYIEKRLMNKLGWSQKKTKEAIRKYKNFLLLILKYPEQQFAPTSDIDEVWHNHILFTRDYTNDCQAIFGKYIHHNPYKNTGPKENHMKQKIGSQTSDIYFQEFHEKYIPENRKV